MQRLTIAGNVGKDAVLRRTQSDDAVLGFSLAVDNGKDRDGNKRDSTWYDCSLFGKRAESLAPHIKKGDKLTLSGRPSVRVHEGKAYLGISVDDLTFMGSAGARDGGSRDESDDYAAKRSGSGGPGRWDLDDDIPFGPEVRA